MIRLVVAAILVCVSLHIRCFADADSPVERLVPTSQDVVVSMVGFDHGVVAARYGGVVEWYDHRLADHKLLYTGTRYAMRHLSTSSGALFGLTEQGQLLRWNDGDQWAVVDSLLTTVPYIDDMSIVSITERGTVSIHDARDYSLLKKFDLVLGRFQPRCISRTQLGTWLIGTRTGDVLLFDSGWSAIDTVAGIGSRACSSIRPLLGDDWIPDFDEGGMYRFYDALLGGYRPIVADNKLVAVQEIQRWHDSLVVIYQIEDGASQPRQLSVTSSLRSIVPDSGRMAQLGSSFGPYTAAVSDSMLYIGGYTGQVRSIGLSASYERADADMTWRLYRSLGVLCSASGTYVREYRDVGGKGLFLQIVGRGGTVVGSIGSKDEPLDMRHFNGLQCAVETLDSAIVIGDGQGLILRYRLRDGHLDTTRCMTTVSAIVRSIASPTLLLQGYGTRYYVSMDNGLTWQPYPLTYSTKIRGHIGVIGTTVYGSGESGVVRFDLLDTTSATIFRQTRPGYAVIILEPKDAVPLYAAGILYADSNAGGLHVMFGSLVGTDTSTWVVPVPGAVGGNYRFLPTTDGRILALHVSLPLGYVVSASGNCQAIAIPQTELYNGLQDAAWFGIVGRDTLALVTLRCSIAVKIPEATTTALESVRPVYFESAFPNPARTAITVGVGRHVNADAPSVAFGIYDLNGGKMMDLKGELPVWSGLVDVKPVKVDVSTLANGPYLLVVSNKSYVESLLFHVFR